MKISSEHLMQAIFMPCVHGDKILGSSELFRVLDVHYIDHVDAPQMKPVNQPNQNIAHHRRLTANISDVAL